MNQFSNVFKEIPIFSALLLGLTYIFGFIRTQAPYIRDFGVLPYEYTHYLYAGFYPIVFLFSICLFLLIIILSIDYFINYDIYQDINYLKLLALYVIISIAIITIVSLIFMYLKIYTYNIVFILNLIALIILLSFIFINLLIIKKVEDEYDEIKNMANEFINNNNNESTQLVLNTMKQFKGRYIKMKPVLYYGLVAMILVSIIHSFVIVHMFTNVVYKYKPNYFIVKSINTDNDNNYRKIDVVLINDYSIYGYIQKDGNRMPIIINVRSIESVIKEK